MSKSCVTCNSPDRQAIDKASDNGQSCAATARYFGISRSALARHRAHASSAPTAGSHVEAANALIAAVELLRGADWSAQDAAGAAALRSLAAAVDSDPGNISALREMRISLDGYRETYARRSVEDVVTDPSLMALDLIFNPSDPDLYDRTRDAAILAGATVFAAQCAAAAAANGPAHVSYSQAMAEVNPRPGAMEAAMAYDEEQLEKIRQAGRSANAAQAAGEETRRRMDEPGP